ncbi:hypothetical protein Y032_0026g1472 [Ancylostoma ceylanicum]|uniref:G-protein coupled receptors family 1 profile domain-containing protein n=1 Tax=Ancylostoma ceylanicum TaxID=53326 RepID=A0A016UU36_9BILA|nr:hypothetical protein Y032_0026g1472 [Ancylostoma ceylanicum]
MRTVFKSISITVAIVIVGWFTTFLINSLSFLITNSDYVRMVINMYAGITVNIGTAANVFVYYAIKYVLLQNFVAKCSIAGKCTKKELESFSEAKWRSIWRGSFGHLSKEFVN